MKYVIFSDVHGDAEWLKKVLKRVDIEEPEAIIVLGDLLYHGPRNFVPAGYEPAECAKLLNQYQDRIIAVRGNCDAEVDQVLLSFAIEAPYMILPLGGGKRLMITHGHLPLSELHVQEKDIMVSGHTHLPRAEKADGHYWINPGSVSMPREGNPHSYAVLEEDVVTIKTLEGEPMMALKIE